MTNHEVGKTGCAFQAKRYHCSQPICDIILSHPRFILLEKNSGVFPELLDGVQHEHLIVKDLKLVPATAAILGADRLCTGNIRGIRCARCGNPKEELNLKTSDVLCNRRR